jgi:hypothetical protein
LIERFDGEADDGAWWLDLGLANPDLEEKAKDFVSNIMGMIEELRNEKCYEYWYSDGLYPCK